MNEFNPSRQTHTQYLIGKAKRVGHYAYARWAVKQGYSFKYTYFVIFGKYPATDCLYPIENKRDSTIPN